MMVRYCSAVSAVVVVSVLGAGCAATEPTASGEALTTTTDQLESPELELVEWDAQLELGVTYQYPLYIHCGMGYLANFNDTHWYLVDAPQGETETGAGQVPDPRWPVADQTVFGMVTVIDNSTIEYSIPNGDVIGIYTSSDDLPPGCD